MKDEELADKYAEEYFGKKTELVDLWKVKTYKDAFLAGLKAGRPQFHDLWKDPNDLPKDKRHVWCDYDDGYGKGFYDKDDGGWWIEGHIYCSIIVAWCEIPTFDKELKK